MADCRNCRHPYCSYVGVDRGGLVECANYLHPLKPTKPITNADRIRAMSDDELVDLFRYRGCPPDRLTGKCVKVCVCEACWVDWLQQPVEEVSDG